MSSSDERIRAVMLYIKPGENLGSTLRKLGYTLTDLLAEVNLAVALTFITSPASGVRTCTQMTA